MKRLILVLLLCCGMLFLTGCGSKHYTLHMKSGEEVVAVGKPKYDKKSDTLSFKNVNGQNIIVQKQDIDKVVENLK
jgi:hypothetical protein